MIMLIRKLVKVFRGEAAPILIVIGTTLGFWFGLTPGWYGIHVAVLAVCLVLNINLGVFLLSAALGKTAMALAAPVLFHAGVWVQDSAAGLPRFLAQIPIIALTDFARCAVCGALLIGPLVGLALGVALAMMVTSFRHRWLNWEESSEKFRRWNSNRTVRWLQWILLGRTAKDVKAVLEGKPRYIRLPGVVTGVVLALVCWVGLSFVQDEMVTRHARESLSFANGAQVDVERVSLAALAGSVGVKKLAATDPDQPTRNRVTVAGIDASVSLWNLLLGRVVVDDLKLNDVRFDQPRSKAGELIDRRMILSESPPFDPNRYKVAPVDAAQLDEYLKESKEARDWLKKIGEYLPDEAAKYVPMPPPTPASYLAYVDARRAGAPSPRFIVRKVTLQNVQIPSPYMGMSDVSCANMSDAPLYAGLAISVEAKSKQHPNNLSATLHYDDVSLGASIKAAFGDIDLREIASKLSEKLPVQFEAGKASGAIEGRMSRSTVDLSLRVKITGLKARTAGGGFFGLDSQVAEEAVKLLENIETTLRLVGPLNDPRLVLDSTALTKELRDALVKAGKEELVRRIDAVIADKLPGGMPKTEQIAEDPLGAVQQGVGAFLDNNKSDDKDKKKKEAEKKNEKKSEDPLSKLRDKLKKP